SGTFSQPAIFQSTLYYEPHLIETDFQYSWERLKLSTGLSFQLWKAFEPAFPHTQTQTGRGTEVSNTLPSLTLRNTFNPRISLEYSLIPERLFWSLGYQFRLSPLSDTSGPTNLLDTNAHLIGTSIAFHLLKTDFFPPLEFGLFVQYHYFPERKVEKASP